VAINVLQGRVLGGGGVINACDVVPIPDGVLEFWQSRHGLSEFTPATLAPYTAQALKDLSASRITEDELNRNNGLLKLGAEKLGLRGEAMLHNRVGCEELGTCLIGCPVDAKRNPRFVAIPEAISHGVRFYTRARAVRVEDATQEIKRITVHTLDGKGYQETGSFEVRARVVVLAANAIGSTQLLLRSGIGNAHVGRHLTLQPQLPVMAVFEEEVRAYEGIPQAYAVTEYENEHDAERGLWGFRVESIMGTPGIIASLMPYVGTDLKRKMAEYARLAAALLLVPDEPSGEVGLLASGRPRIRYQHRENHKQRVRQAIRTAARIFLAAGATRVDVPVAPPLSIRSEADLTSVDELAFAPATAPFVSAHQQGGVRFAPSPKQGAADPSGQVYGTSGIYVFDSSGYPSSASSHIMAPIITISRYLSTRLGEELSG
jgi:choline dehydrogenase-like flavoprotein